MKQKIREAGLDWEVDSAGTGHWHAGELPDRRSIVTASQHGIDITDQRARQFQSADFERFDKIFVMDTQNYRDVLRLARSEEQRAKVELILDQLQPGHHGGGHALAPSTPWPTIARRFLTMAALLQNIDTVKVFTLLNIDAS